MRRYSFTYGGMDGVIQIDDAAFDAEHKDQARTPGAVLADEEIVQHIAWNMLANDLDIDRIDGWADLPRDAAMLLVKAASRR